MHAFRCFARRGWHFVHFYDVNLSPCLYTQAQVQGAWCLYPVWFCFDNLYTVGTPLPPGIQINLPDKFAWFLQSLKIRKMLSKHGNLCSRSLWDEPRFHRFREEILRWNYAWQTNVLRKNTRMFWAVDWCTRDKINLYCFKHNFQ